MNISPLHYANKKRGFVLVSVLLFLQVLSMLGLYALQNGFLLQIISHEQMQKQTQLLQAENILQQLERINPIQCFIPRMTRNDLLAQPLTWWQARVGCGGQIDRYQYYFTVEGLGESPCAYIDSKESDKSVYYYRINLLLLNKNDDIKQMMQSTIIKIDNIQSHCEGKLYKVYGGRQMWRNI